MIRRAFPFISHTLVAGAGWTLVTMVQPAFSSRRTEVPVPGPGAQSGPSKSQIREPGTGEGSRLLGDLMDKRDRLMDFRDILPAADRAVAARNAMQAFHGAPADRALLREAAARLAHWLATDPEAAMAAWDSHATSPGFIRRPFSTLLARATADAGIDSLLACLQRPADSDPAHLHVPIVRSSVLLPILAKAIAATGSASDLKEAINKLQATQGTILLGKAIQAWPANRLETLAPLLAGSMDAEVLTSYFQRLPNSQQRGWLLAQFGGELPDDPAQARLLSSLVNQATALPLQEQLEWLARLDHASGRKGISYSGKDPFIRDQITEYLSRMSWTDDSALSDWRFRLRHGQISAAEVMAEVRRAMPEAAASEPDLLARNVYQHVATYDPEGAMDLLAELPVADREKLMLESAFSSAGTGNPQALLGLVNTLPSHSGSNADERFRVWLRAANPNVAKHGDSYGAWVMALPPGAERDMALSGLAAHFDADDPQAAAAYRAAKTLPDDSNPGP